MGSIRSQSGQKCWANTPIRWRCSPRKSWPVNSRDEATASRRGQSGLTEKEREYVANLEKNKGNEAFKVGDYGEAVLYYTRSLSVLRSTVTLNNRAQAYIKLRNYLAAIQDCSEVLSQEPNNIKALYRRGIAYKEEGINDLAKLDFKIILEMDPENKLAKEQLKKIRQIKLPKTANKKVIIEEVMTDESENTKNQADDHKNSEISTRLKIEEVNTEATVSKLTNLNYSSDEDDDNLQLPQKVKQMLKISSLHDKQKNIPNSVCGNEIDKKPVGVNKKQDVSKPKIVEVDHASQSNSNTESKGSQQYNKHDKEFVSVQIKDYVSTPTKSEVYSIDNNKSEIKNSKSECGKEAKIGKIDDIKNKIDDEKINEKCTNFTTEEEINDENAVKFPKLNYRKIDNICHKKFTKVNTSRINEVNANEAKSFGKCTDFEEKLSDKTYNKELDFNGKIPEGNSKKSTTEKQSSLEKITPYEFLCTWWSNNAGSDMMIGAEYLLKIQPQELPNIISNKLDTSVLCGLLKAIVGIYKMGKQSDGESYLYYLIKVPRFKIISMLLSDDEVQDIQYLFSTLEKETGIHTNYVNKILQI